MVTTRRSARSKSFDGSSLSSSKQVDEEVQEQQQAPATVPRPRRTTRGRLSTTPTKGSSKSEDEKEEDIDTNVVVAMRRGRSSSDDGSKKKSATTTPPKSNPRRGGSSAQVLERMASDEAEISQSKTKDDQAKSGIEKSESSSLNWIQCDDCGKWRVVVELDAAVDSLGNWVCSMNTADAQNNTCQASEKNQSWYERQSLLLTAEKQNNGDADESRDKDSEEEESDKEQETSKNQATDDNCVEESKEQVADDISVKSSKEEGVDGKRDSSFTRENNQKADTTETDELAATSKLSKAKPDNIDEIENQDEEKIEILQQKSERADGDADSGEEEEDQVEKTGEKAVEKSDTNASAKSPKERRRFNRSRSRGEKKSSWNRSATKKPKNALTKVLPGYTAPLHLTTTTWSAQQQNQPGKSNSSSTSALESLRRQAMREETASKRASASVQIMAERSTTGNFTAAYRESHAGFHQKRKKRLPSSANATAGAGWFNMKPTPMTEEVERDIALIRNRNYLDPKRFYKSTDLPRNGNKRPMLQTGTVVEGPTEFYSSRLTKKQRKSTLVSEIMADKESAQWAQKKFKNMQQEKEAASRKWGKNIPNRQEFRRKKAP